MARNFLGWQIERYDKHAKIWRSMFPFEGMRKSYAQGAWAMLKAFYGGNEDAYRLVDDKDNVVESNNKGPLTLNSEKGGEQ